MRGRETVTSVFCRLLRDDDALRLLGQAVASDPTLYAAAFDISVLHHMNGRTDKAVAAAQPVAAGAADLLAHYRRATFRAPDAAVTHNRAFVDVLPHARAVLDAGLAPNAAASAMAAVLADGFLSGQVGERAMGGLGFFVVLWAVLFGIKGRLEPATACSRCGSPASRRVDGKEVPAATCAQCFHVFVSTKSRIDGSAKALKEREIVRRNRREGRAIRALGVCLPGAGHIYGGAPVRGALFLVAGAVAGAGLALAMGLLPLPHPPGPWPQTPALAGAGGALALVWLLAVRSAFALAAERR